MKEVNLKEILDRHTHENVIYYPQWVQDDTIEAMREACSQAIDLCAENAEATFETLDNHKSYPFVDNNSILKTKKQII